MSQDATLHPQLEDCWRQHEDVRLRYERLLDGITPEQFNFCPAPGRWTIGQNIEHLSLEGEEQVAIIQRILDRGSAEQAYADGPFRYSRWGNAYIRFLEPPYKTRIPTLPRYTAVPVLAIESVVPRFMKIKQQVLELIHAANGLDLARLKAPLPYLKGWNPSLSLGQWFPYIAVHERRHLWQIQNIQRAAGYPQSSASAALPRARA